MTNDRKQLREVETDEKEIVKSLEYPFKGRGGFESLAHIVA